MMEALDIIGILGGIVGLAVGALMIFAGGMSDAPTEGEAVSKQGCIVAVIALLVVIASIVGLVL